MIQNIKIHEFSLKICQYFPFFFLKSLQVSKKYCNFASESIKKC